MSESSRRGRDFEIKVQNLTSRILKLVVKRDKQSGSGLHKQDVRDQYNQVPLFIECKDQETLKPKEWWRVANAKASYGQAPVVVFPDNEEILCVMRYSDLLNFIAEGNDWHETAESERRNGVGVTRHAMSNAEIAEAIERKKAGSVKQCKNGHIADEYGYCNTKGCKYSRGYKPPKDRKK